MTVSSPGPVLPVPAIADAIIEALSQPAAILDEALRVVSANSRFARAFAPDGRGSGLTVPGSAASLDRLRDGLAIAGRAECEVEVDVPALGSRRLILHAARLLESGLVRSGILLTIEDVTEKTPVPGWSKSVSRQPAAPAAEDASRVLAAATHDLRQPLQAMTLLGSLLARRIDDPAVSPLIRRLEDTVTVMSNMLTTMLDINRWDAGATRAAPANFAITELFDRLEAEFLPRMRHSRMRWRVMPCRRTVHTDQRLLGQMLHTMINYLLERWQDGRVLLGARRRGQRLRIELWGSALVPDEQDAEAMTQAVREALRPAKGRTPSTDPTLVAGLVMVRRIADLLGHRIDIMRRPGRGVVFSVDLPLVLGAPAQVKTAPPVHVAKDTDRQVRGTVFVVDDDPSVREALRDVLEATGWASEAFASSEQFLAADHPGRSGCVVVDALLPGMSGVALLRVLKEQRHRLPAIMLTGAGDVRMAVEAMAVGALNFIEKPVRYEELLPVIERAFDTLADATKLAGWREQSLRRTASLTARQREILDRVLAGEPSRNIAADLGVSRRTVENHRAIIMKKMGAASIPELIRAGIAAS